MVDVIFRVSMNLVLYMSFRIFVYSSNTLKTNFDLSMSALYSLLLVHKPGGNTKVWNLVETQTLRFGGEFEGQETMRERWKRPTLCHCLTPRGGDFPHSQILFYNK
jgi:hypothetical protein